MSILSNNISLYILIIIVQIPCQTIVIILLMSNNFFRFKQFTVFQDHCAMKVGTDGVLLGAWTEVTKCSYVLDIGTGTGLIALMIAQRNPKAIIDAIDIDKECVMQAQQNVINSPFKHRIHVQRESFQRFVQQKKVKYDLIISNPPYFQNSVKPPNLARSNARHTDSLSFYEIISEGVSLLTNDGIISLILPYDFKQTVLEYAATENLFVHRITNVFPVPHKSPKRLLVEFGKREVEFVEQNLTIELSRHQYTDEFKALTRDFYLDR